MCCLSPYVVVVFTSLWGLCFCWQDCHYAAVAAVVGELYCAVNQRIERVVAAHAYILAGIMNRTSLADDDVACYASLAATYLNA